MVLANSWGLLQCLLLADDANSVSLRHVNTWPDTMPNGSLSEWAKLERRAFGAALRCFPCNMEAVDGLSHKLVAQK